MNQSPLLKAAKSAVAKQLFRLPRFMAPRLFHHFRTQFQRSTYAVARTEPINFGMEITAIYKPPPHG